MKVFSTIHFILLFIISTDIFAQNITGEWFTKNQDAKVKLYQCQNKICGDIVWLKDPLWSEKEAKTLPNIKAGEIKTDIHNPDKSLKTVPLPEYDNIFDGSISITSLSNTIPKGVLFFWFFIAVAPILIRYSYY